VSAEWDRIARPLMLNTLAVLAEFLDDPRPQDFPALRARLRAAARCHDIEALQQVSEDLKSEAYRMMVLRERRLKDRAA
jgi:hypothetical protein